MTDPDDRIDAEDTTDPAGVLCAWCQGELPDRTGPGRPARFCSDACRSSARERRRTINRQIGQLLDKRVGVVARDREWEAGTLAYIDRELELKRAELRQWTT